VGRTTRRYPAGGAANSSTASSTGPPSMAPSCTDPGLSTT